MVEPLDPAAAKALAVSILDEDNGMRIADHADEEMTNDDLLVDDVIAVIRGGAPKAAEFEKGTWRYRIETTDIVAVIAFRQLAFVVLVLVTTFRKK